MSYFDNLLEKQASLIVAMDGLTRVAADDSMAIAKAERKAKDKRTDHNYSRARWGAALAGGAGYAALNHAKDWNAKINSSTAKRLAKGGVVGAAAGLGATALTHGSKKRAKMRNNEETIQAAKNGEY